MSPLLHRSAMRTTDWAPAGPSPAPPTVRCREIYEAAAALGRRPRRAAGTPGILPAQSSQRSACFEPRRASEYVIRITAPLASSTSLPQLSQTSTVFLATNSSFERKCEPNSTLPGAPLVFATIAAGSASPAPPDRARSSVRSRSANAAVGNRRSFAHRDTVRSPPARYRTRA